MKKAPKKIDGVDVLEWAWSGDEPFGMLLYDNGEVASEIYGLAICQDESSKIIHRFSCNYNWEVEQDSVYESLLDAKSNLPKQYCNVSVNWQSI